jgi:hypothetical protein
VFAYLVDVVTPSVISPTHRGVVSTSPQKKTQSTTRTQVVVCKRAGRVAIKPEVDHALGVGGFGEDYTLVLGESLVLSYNLAEIIDSGSIPENLPISNETSVTSRHRSWYKRE